MGSCCEILGEMSGSLLLAVCLGLISVAQCGLLGAGTGHGSCPAFPNRPEDFDHVGGCPRYAECCTEFGYCHPLDSWEKGYFRDCNGKSNGQPLPGSVIKLEAEQAALGSSSAITAEFLGITQEIWQKQVKRATSLLSVSSLSSSSSSTSSVQDSSFSSVQDSSFSSQSSLSSSALVQQILLAIQPQVALAVQNAVGSSSSSVSDSSFSSLTSGNSASAVSSSGQFNSGSSLGFSSQSGLSSGQFGIQTNRVDGINLGSINSGNRSNSGSISFSGQSSDQGLDVSRIVALVISQITPEITAAVQSVIPAK